MSTSVKLSKDESGKKVESKLYRSMIGSLLYLIASRPNISFSVGVCAIFQANPTESHLLAVKRIMKYGQVRTTLVCGFLLILTLPWLDIVMRIGLVALMIVRAHQGVASTLEII